MKVDLVIFDMDGTLINSEVIARDAFILTGKEFGVPVTEESFKEYIGLSAKSVKEKLLKEYGDVDKVETFLYAKDLTMKYMIREHGIELKPGVIELLDYLKEKGYKMAVGTSTKHNEAVEKLRLTNILDYFSVVVGGDEVNEGKPSPDIYLKVAELNKTTPSNCLVFEDSKQGVAAGVDAGMKVILVPDMLTPTEKMIKSSFRVYETIDQAKELL